MATNVSDRNGRALEFRLAEILSQQKSYSLTQRAIEYNNRDKSKYLSIPTSLQNDYSTASNKICNWLSTLIPSNTSALVDRLGDEADSVDDIVITTPSSSIHLSLKHNHHALKHPRPYSFAQFCNYPKNSKEDVQHRQAMDTVANSFRSKLTNQTLFNQCSNTEIDALYSGVCNACSNSLTNWAKSNPTIANSLFNFLVNKGYYKVIVETRGSLVVKIQDYSSIPNPTSVIPTTSANRLILKFNNGWEINNRIHTASSRISEIGKQLSLKFDAQRVTGTINEITL